MELDARATGRMVLGAGATALELMGNNLPEGVERTGAGTFYATAPHLALPEPHDPTRCLLCALPEPATLYHIDPELADHVETTITDFNRKWENARAAQAPAEAAKRFSAYFGEVFAETLQDVPLCAAYCWANRYPVGRTMGWLARQYTVDNPVQLGECLLPPYIVVSHYARHPREEAAEVRDTMMALARLTASSAVSRDGTVDAGALRSYVALVDRLFPGVGASGGGTVRRRRRGGHVK
jgi:hypothetical protein